LPCSDGAVYEQPLLPPPIDETLRYRLRQEVLQARRGQEAVQKHTVESADRSQTSEQHASAAVRFRELLKVRSPCLPCLSSMLCFGAMFARLRVGHCKVP
jgi:hypothetical protein